MRVLIVKFMRALGKPLPWLKLKLTHLLYHNDFELTLKRHASRLRLSTKFYAFCSFFRCLALAFTSTLYSSSSVIGPASDIRKENTRPIGLDKKMVYHPPHRHIPVYFPLSCRPANAIAVTKSHKIHLPLFSHMEGNRQSF
jgi:hypothetical protein